MSFLSLSIKKTIGSAIVGCLLLGFHYRAEAQISLPVNHPDRVEMKGNATESVEINLEIGQLKQLTVQTVKGQFSEIAFENCLHTNVAGEPKIPVLRKLIEIPQGATCEVSIVSESYNDYSLEELGIEHPIMPAQGPISKEFDDASVLPFHYNEMLYSKDAFTNSDKVAVTAVGQMRALNLELVEVFPVQYNPVRNVLRIYDKLTVKVVFHGGNLAATDALKKKYSSPYFMQAYKMVGNFSEGGSKELITDSPVTYVIISDPMFQTALQPFIQWKTKKGFKVIEGYTNNASVGTTTTSIKNYLQGLYNNPPAGYNAPSFVLFVGDVAQIPTFSGTAGSHPTDLYYCEYTGDKIPEVYYGRFSATTVAQLQPQIDKTLEYEQYLFPSSDFLGRALLVAGADAGHQLTWGNGQVNYGTSNYFNTAHNYNALALLQPEPSGANYHQQIVNKISEGVSIANYSAHCSESGWADPSFVISDIAGLTNTSKYSLMIGNCCLSNRFNTTCFGEEQLRAVNKGALGYIGGTNSTYWDEDFWWACGMKTVSANPTYDPNHLGAFDAVFHDHGEDPDDWFVTQGQMVVGGNMAVEESNSSMKTYYWEIYHLMGDPSVSIFLSVPSVLTATYQNTMLIGMSSLTVNTEQYAYVALSKSGVLLAPAMAGPTGVVNLTLPALSSVGNCDIVITKQNRQPHIGQIQVVPASGPYIVYDSHTISDPTGNNNGQMDYGEVNGLNVGLKNVGVADATNVTATLSTTDSYVTITDNTQGYGTIAAGSTVLQNNAFSVTVANNIPDQHVVNFALSSVSGANTWNSTFSVTANAPEMSIGDLTIDDSGAGCNNDGILDPGETANIVIATGNAGHSSVGNVVGGLSINGGSSPYLTLNTTSSSIGTLIAGGTGNATFSVTAAPTTPLGTPVDLTYTVTAGSASQYTASSVKQVVIGLMPTYVISNGSVTTCTGYFYDSGGESGSYQNNESYTMTFNPGTTNAKVKATFLSFSTESGYDYLYIYNGPTTSSPQVSGSPFSGSTSPGTIQSTHSSGALTFRFTSDYSQTSTGWKAQMQCIGGGPSPVVNFTANQTSFCTPGTVTFTDQSTNSPTSWSWSFPGGTPSTSNLQNPTVTYSTTGTYDVTLISTNQYGDGTLTKTSYISANGAPAAPTTPTGNSDLCMNPVNTTYTTTAVSGATGYLWQLSPSTAGVLTPNGTTVTVDWDNTFTGLVQLSVKATNACGEGNYSQPLNITVSDIPVTPDQPSGLAQVCHNSSTQYTVTAVSGATDYTWTLTPGTAGTVIPNGTLCTVNWTDAYTGIASLTVKATNTCGESPNSPGLDIDVSSGPMLYTITGGGFYCEGSSGVEVGLDGSDLGINYSLLLNGTQTGVIVPGTGETISFGDQTTVGTYSVLGASVSCEVNMNGSAAVSVKTAPTMPAVPTGPNYVNATITPTTDFETTGSPEAVTYAWKLEPTEAGAIGGSNTTGTAVWGSTFYCGLTYITVSAVNECGESGYTAAFTPQVDNFVGIVTAEQSGYKVYPVPARQVLTVESPVEGAMCSLVNMMGQVSTEGQLTTGKNAIQVGYLSSGVYLLRIIDNGKTIVMRIVLEK